MISRRAFIGASLGAAGAGIARRVCASDDRAPAPSMAAMVRDPLLAQSLYRRVVGKDYSPDGAVGPNRDGYRWIEEQRQGAEWIVRGVVQNNQDWIALGWREIDWGLARQQDDGGFASGDAFHSTALFTEALARSCLLDRAGATTDRVAALARSASWLMRPDVEAPGARHNTPYTHRRYILSAAFGESAAATGNTAFADKALAWANEGVALQQPNGTNPERGGFDAGYQMVGVLMALRYLPTCGDPTLRASLRAMIRRAVPPELARQQPDGSIDLTGSTRIGLEAARSGKIKGVPYDEIFQGLVFAAAALPQPAWVAPARRIAVYRGWISS